VDCEWSRTKTTRIHTRSQQNRRIYLAGALSRALISSPDLWIAMAKAFTAARIRPEARYSLFD
jgi:hypothetical protein